MHHQFGYILRSNFSLVYDIRCQHAGRAHRNIYYLVLAFCNYFIVTPYFSVIVRINVIVRDNHKFHRTAKCL